MKREELIRSKEYWITQVQAQLFEAVHNYLESEKMTRTQFAEQLGVSKGYISQVLNGDFDHKLSKFVELLLSCGKVPIMKIEGIEDYVSDEQCGAKTISYKDFGLRIRDNKNIKSQKTINAKFQKFHHYTSSPVSLNKINKTVIVNN